MDGPAADQITRQRVGTSGGQERAGVAMLVAWREVAERLTADPDRRRSCACKNGASGVPSTLSPSPAVALSRTRRLRAVEGAPRCCDLKLQELLDGTHAAGSLSVDAALLASTDPVAIPLFPGAETSVPHAPASAARDQAAVEEPDSKPQRINQLLCERLPRM